MLQTRRYRLGARVLTTSARSARTCCCHGVDGVCVRRSAFLVGAETHLGRVRLSLFDGQLALRKFAVEFGEGGVRLVLSVLDGRLQSCE